MDPYGSTASDVYHDLFDQGTYTGKGIFQVEAFFTCLDGRFPENAILSHDLRRQLPPGGPAGGGGADRRLPL